MNLRAYDIDNEIKMLRRKLNALEYFKNSQEGVIIVTVCSLLDVDLNLINGKCRKQNVSEARFIISTVLSRKGLKEAEIARITNMDRCSVRHHLQRYAELVSIKDKVFMWKVELINKAIEA